MSNQKADLMVIAKTIEDIKERKRIEQEEKHRLEDIKKQSNKKVSEGNKPSDTESKLDDWEISFNDGFNEDEFDWEPITVEEYTVPPFTIPTNHKQANQREDFSKVLAFIDLVKHMRVVDGCTIMPIPTTNKRMLSICGYEMKVTRLRWFMEAIGLIEPESEDYQFNANNPEYNNGQTFRYYYENEIKIKEYCEAERINCFEISNVDEKLLEIINYEIDDGGNVSVFNIFDDGAITSFEPSEVRFSSQLHLFKPKNYSKAQFLNYLKIRLWINYPQLLHYQLLSNRINKEFYSNLTEFKIWFTPSFKFNRGDKSVRKIGIRATNNMSNARASREKVSSRFYGAYKEDFLREYGLNLEKDVKSSVPRITASINNGYWINEEIDLYEEVDMLYREIADEEVSVVNTFAERRGSIKSLFMRGYFDSENMIGTHTRNAMGKYLKNSSDEERDAIDNTMKAYKEAITNSLGGHLFDSEIFLHESCIYMDVLYHLLNEGYQTWICYDAFYSKKEGITQEYYENHVRELVEFYANRYIQKYCKTR